MILFLLIERLKDIVQKLIWHQPTQKSTKSRHILERKGMCAVWIKRYISVNKVFGCKNVARGLKLVFKTIPQNEKG